MLWPFECTNGPKKRCFFTVFHYLLPRIPIYLWGGHQERRISRNNGQDQPASRINEHLAFCPLPKRNMIRLYGFPRHLAGQASR
jgi:hypothetical protein